MALWPGPAGKDGTDDRDGQPGRDGLGLRHSGDYVAGKVYEPGDLFVRQFSTWLVNDAGETVLFVARGDRGKAGDPGKAGADGKDVKPGHHIHDVKLAGSRLQIVTSEHTFETSLLPLAEGIASVVIEHVQQQAR